MAMVRFWSEAMRAYVRRRARVRMWLTFCAFALSSAFMIALGPPAAITFFCMSACAVASAAPAPAPAPAAESCSSACAAPCPSSSDDDDDDDDSSTSSPSAPSVGAALKESFLVKRAAFRFDLFSWVIIAAPRD